MPLGLKSQVNVKKHNFGEANMSISLLSNNEGKSGNKESDRKLNNCSYSKRPRIDQSESNATNVRGDDVIFQKNTDSLMRSASTDKARMIKPKRNLDAKRNDRKNFRSGIKARFDTLTSKVGFAGTDSTCGGNSLLGINGLKSDLCDVSKNMDEPGLTELLEGSYNYSNSNVEKGKKHSIVSENMIASVRKAFSILPNNFGTDCHHNNEDKKTTICLTNPSSSSSMPDCHHNIKEVAESSSVTKFPNLADVDLYQPKKVLECLALPPQNLDALLSDKSLTSCVLKTTLSKETCNSASLPPFSWSISHSGACKPNADSSRQVSAKNTCQSKWLKIDRNSVLAGGNQHCVADLELLIFNNNEDSLKRSNVIRDDHVESSFKCHEPSGQVFPMSTSVETNIIDDTKLETKSCLSVSLISKRLNLMDEQTNSSLTRLECDSKDNFSLGASVTECSLKMQGKDSHLLDQARSTPPFSNTEDAGKDMHDMRTLNKHVCSSVCCCVPSKDAARENGKSTKFPTLDASKPVYSSREIHAAEILMEISRSCKILKHRRQDFGGIKLSEMPLQKSVKPQKSISIMERSESSLFRTRNPDPVRTVPLPQWEHKSSDKRKDISYMRNSGRVPTKYSARLESGVSPLKLEKDLLVGARSLHNVTVRSMGLIASAARVENGHDAQQKHRKTSMTTSIVGSCIKDWGRGRNKQD